MRKTLAVLCLLVGGLSAANQAPARDLVELIPSLYGGDGITLAPPTGPFPSHAAHFTLESAAAINQLNQNIAAQVAAFPFSSFSGGFAFEFDPALGTFVKVTETLGPFFADRPRTIGKGKFSFLVSYTKFSYDEFEGTDLSDLQSRALHVDCCFGPGLTSFELDTIRINFDLDIDVDILSFAGTYGVTDRLDVGILIPYTQVDMDVRSRAAVVVSPMNPFPTAHVFGVERPNDSASGSASGLGDIILRAKYHWIKTDTNNLAAAVIVKTATGDEDDFLGTGETTVRPMLAYARAFGKFVPHANLGYEFNLEESDENSVEYALGFEYGATPSVTLNVGVLGSHEPDGDGIGDDIVDGTLGVKWAPAKKVVLSANALFPLNDDGLRSDLISTVALEYGF